MDVPAVSNVLGTLGAVCWSVQLVPQIVINYRRHNATGLQPSMMMLWAWAGVPLGVYNIVSNFNVALQVQPQILSFLSLATWIQVYYYEKDWSVAKSLALVIPVACLMAGIEAALIFSLRGGVGRGTTWPVTLMAVLAAPFLALGVLRHYWDIYVHRTVRGISFIFCGIDALGDLASLISVLFQPSLDVLGMVVYGVELALWLGIFACGGYYNLGPWLQGKCAPDTVVDADPPPEAITPVPEALYLHDMPSSTSAFRTSSASIDAPGPRNRATGAQALSHRML